MEFWRSGERVLYHYPEQKIADKWLLTSNGYLKPTRFFLSDERAIEYDAFDINGGKGSKDWQSRVQWVSQEKLDSMQKTGSSGEGCTRLETYVSIPADTEGKKGSFAGVELSWMPELRLVQRYRVKSTDALGLRRMMQWQLDELETEQTLVEARLHSFDGYATTDFADVGDNESDPFLMKMIRLGFVEHGAAGFYNSDGSPLAGGQHVH